MHVRVYEQHTTIIMRHVVSVFLDLMFLPQLLVVVQCGVKQVGQVSDLRVHDDGIVLDVELSDQAAEIVDRHCVILAMGGRLLLCG